MTAPYSFWNLYSPNESCKELEDIFIHSLGRGITPPINGVRNCTSISNINNTRFIVQDANATENGRWLDWRPAAYVTEDTWDDFVPVAKAIRAKWPGTLISDGKYERFLQDEFAHLIELSYNRYGFPKVVNGPLKSFLAVPARTRNEDIFGTRVVRCASRRAVMRNSAIGTVELVLRLPKQADGYGCDESPKLWLLEKHTSERQEVSVNQKC